jgi:Tol biopolymer transport system component
MPCSRTTLLTITCLLVFVWLSGLPVSGQEPTGVRRPAAQQAQRTTTSALHNGKIAFMGIRSRDARTTNNWEIYTVNADGSGLAKLTNNPAIDLSPSWSPDGRKIAFMRNGANVTNSGTAENIYVMNADGTGQKRLTDTNVDSDPAWSPDGSKIAFISGRAGGSHDIFIMDADGGNVRRLTNNGRLNFSPFWSPDGTKVAFVSQFTSPAGDNGETSEIYTVNIDGTGEKVLTNNNMSEGNGDWSPDGRRIVFQATSGVNIMNANGTQQNTLFPGGTGPAWSPDGKKITFVGLAGEITTMNPDGSGLTPVTNTPDLVLGEPDWQPITGAGTGNADTVTTDTVTASTGTAGTVTTGTRNARGTGAGQGIGDRTAIPEPISVRSLPGTGGLALLAPAIGLLLISGAVARLVVRRRYRSGGTRTPPGSSARC